MSGTVNSPPLFYNTARLSNTVFNFKPSDTDGWTLLDYVNIYLKGDEPSASSKVKDWFDGNIGTIDEQNLRLISTVSSWAIVVEVAWKAEYAEVRN
jgi:hypothetical protein